MTTATKQEAEVPATQEPQPLDVSEFISTDSPELAAFKEQVKTVAKKYAVRHNWCEVVDKALAEMGVVGKNKVTVNVTLAPGFSIPISVQPEELHGKTLAEQQKVIARLLGSVSVYTPVSRTVSVTPDPTTFVLSLGRGAAPSGEAPTGKAWRYASRDGRVRHLFNESDLGSRTWRYIYATCGFSTQVSEATEESPRGEGRNCVKCEARQHN